MAHQAKVPAATPDALHPIFRTRLAERENDPGTQSSNLHMHAQPPTKKVHLILNMNSISGRTLWLSSDHPPHTHMDTHA